MPKRKQPLRQQRVPKKNDRIVPTVRHISTQEFRVLQRIQNRIQAEAELKQEIQLTKLLVQQTGFDYEKCQWVLTACQIPHTCEQFYQHPQYTAFVKGVHLITLSVEDGPLTLKFDIIFKPHNGKFMAYGYRIVEKQDHV